jgi:hypothetical protein
MTAGTPDSKYVTRIIPVSFYPLEHAQRTRQRLGTDVNSRILITNELTVNQRPWRGLELGKRCDMCHDSSSAVVIPAFTGAIRSRLSGLSSHEVRSPLTARTRRPSGSELYAIQLLPVRHQPL